MKKIISVVLTLVLVLGMSVTSLAAFDTLESMDAWKYDKSFNSTDTTAKLREHGVVFSSPSKPVFYDGYFVMSSADDNVTLNPKGGLGGNYTFETEYKISNTNQHYVTFNRNGNSYYKLMLINDGNAGGILQLLKIIDDKTDVLSEVNTAKKETAWWSNWKLNVKVSQEIVEDGIKIIAKLYSFRTGETVTLEYTDTDSAFTSGAATVEFPHCTATVNVLKAYSTPYSNPSIVNKVLANYTGFKGHTLDSLKERGFGFSGLTALDISKKRILFKNNNGKISFAEPGKSVVEGSYNAIFEYSWGYNSHAVKFNYNTTSYYTVTKGTETVDGVTTYYLSLDKVSGETVETLARNSYNALPYPDTFTSLVYDINVDKSSSPAVITVEIKCDEYAGSITGTTPSYGPTYILTASDSTPLVDGKIYIDCQYGGSPTLYNFYCTKKEYVGGSNVNGDAGLYTKAITYNRKIGATDSVDGLLNEGINLAYNKKAETITFSSAGACFNGVTDNAFVMYEPGNLTSDSYVFATKHVTNNQRQSEIRFNVSEDKKTYYQFKFVIPNDYQNPNSHIELYKVVNGTSTLLASNEDADRGAAGAGGTTTLKVIVNKTASGNEITVSATGSRHGGTDSLSYIDSSSPLAAGDFLLGFGSYGGAETFKELSYSIDKLITLNDDLFFYINGAYATGYSKGKIEIEAPIKRIGNYVVVAALYEDYIMTDVVTLSPEEFNSGRVALFDTTNSTAENSYVNVFIFDAEDTLNTLTKVYELK